MINWIRYSTFIFIFFLFIGSRVSAQESAIVQDSVTNPSTLIFNFNVDTVFVQFGKTNPRVQKIANGDTLKVKNGFYHIYLSYPTSKDVYIPQNVLRDSTYTISHNFNLTKKDIDIASDNISVKYLLGGDVIVLTDSDTKIFLNEKYLGDEFAIFTMEESSAQLTVINERFYERGKRINKKDIIQIEYASFYQEKGGFNLYSVLPGFSFVKDKRYGKMALVLGGLVATTGLFLHYEHEYSSKLPDFNSTRKQYLEEENESYAAVLGDQMQVRAKKLDTINLKRNLAIGGIVTVLAVDVIDKIRSNKRSSKPGGKDLDFFVAPMFQKYLTIGAELKF